MKQFKITKCLPLEETIKKIGRKRQENNYRGRLDLNTINRTIRSVAQQKQSVSRRPSPRNSTLKVNQDNSVYFNSPMSAAGNKNDSYFRFVKDEKLNINVNYANTLKRTSKTPLPRNYVSPVVDSRRRSVMDETRYKRVSESPYQRSNKEKDAKKRTPVEKPSVQKRKLQTPRSKQMTIKSSKPSIELLEQQAQKKMFQGIEFFRDLGKGAHALVRSAVDWKHNRKIAVKVYKKNDLSSEEIHNIGREVDILQQIDHSGIAMLYDIIQTPETINLIMEYGGGNSLHQYLRSRTDGRFDQPQAKVLFKQILEAIQYLQTKNIVHRDIKPQNILLNKTKKVKIIDFGFSLFSSIHQKVTTFCGTPTYMAPEIVNKKQHIGLYSDRWSLGVLLYVMIQGVYPFRANSEKQLFKKISKGQIQYTVQVSLTARNLIDKFLRLNPVERISPQEALQDPWFGL